MTDPQPPEHPFSEYLRKPQSRRELREAERARAEEQTRPQAGGAAGQGPDTNTPEFHRPSEPPRTPSYGHEVPLFGSGDTQGRRDDVSTGHFNPWVDDRTDAERAQTAAGPTGSYGQSAQPDAVSAHDALGHDDPIRQLGFDSHAESNSSWFEDGAYSARRATPGTGNRPDAPRKRRRLVAISVLLIILLVLVGGAATVYFAFEAQLRSWFSASQQEDYDGEGTGEVAFVIEEGDVGEVIGDKLAAADIIKSSGTFYRLLLQQTPPPVFQPGTYAMANQMSAQAALARLTDDNYRIENTVTIPEGTYADDVLVELSDVTGIPLEDFQAAAADYVALGVPAEAPSIEGFLFPATYTFEPGVSARDILQIMVNRAIESLDAAGVAPEDRFRIVTLASLVEREAGPAADFPKVSRVFLNRIEDDWLLQSDATVTYGTRNTHTVETTSAERNDASNPYNTYVHPGLPVGPIGNPGDVAIQAAVNPADGPWMYFVTWNLDTGETIFSTTLDEHNAAVQKWRDWMAENGY